jgi:hypothetical protein
MNFCDDRRDLIKGFVEGHGFSRADRGTRPWGFSPCGLEFRGMTSFEIFPAKGVRK